MPDLLAEFGEKTCSFRVFAFVTVGAVKFFRDLITVPARPKLDMQYAIFRMDFFT